MTTKPEIPEPDRPSGRKFDESHAAVQAVVALEARIEFEYLDADGIQGVDYEGWIKAHAERTADGSLTPGCRFDFAGMIRTCLAGRDREKENLAVALLVELHDVDLEAAMEQKGAEFNRYKYIMWFYWDGIEHIEAGLLRYGRLSYRAVRRRLLAGELAGLNRKLASLQYSRNSRRLDKLRSKPGISDSRQRKCGEIQ